MKQLRQFTAVIDREEDGYVAFCPELDITSHEDTAEEAKPNLAEAIEIFPEPIDPNFSSSVDLQEKF